MTVIKKDSLTNTENTMSHDELEGTQQCLHRKGGKTGQFHMSSGASSSENLAPHLQNTESKSGQSKIEFGKYAGKPGLVKRLTRVKMTKGQKKMKNRNFVTSNEIRNQSDEETL